MNTLRRLQRWYGYGPGHAEVVLRPKLIVRLVLYPLLPLTCFMRIELRDGTLRAIGARWIGGPLTVTANTTVTLRRDGAGARAIWYRTLRVSDPSQDRGVALPIAFWTHWVPLLDVLDPDHRLHRHSYDHLPEDGDDRLETDD